MVIVPRTAAGVVMKRIFLRSPAILAATAVLLLVPIPHHAINSKNDTLSKARIKEAANADARIKGVASFLLDRANDNLIYVYSEKLKKNSYINEYFPNTVTALKRSRLEQIVSNKYLWRTSIEKDINLILGNSFKKLIGADYQNDGIDKLTYLGKLQKAYDGLEESRIFISRNFPSINNKKIVIMNIENHVYDFKVQYETLTSDFFIINIYFNKFRDILSGNNSNTDQDIYKNLKKNLLNAKNNIGNCITSLKVISTVLSDIEIRNLQVTDKNAFKEYVKRVTQCKDLNEKLYSCIIKVDEIVESAENKNYPQLVNVCIDFIEESTPELTKETEFQRFRHYSMFLAQLAGAETQEEVSQILHSGTMPSVSFYGKRNGDFNLSIGSYLGLETGLSWSASGDYLYKDRLFFGFFAPVGFEYSFHVQNCSLGLFASVIDLGNVVHSMIYNDNSEFSYRDVFSPGLYLVYGMNDYPISIGGGVNIGRTVKNDPNDASDGDASMEKRVLVFIAIDLPLFPIL
jgi:hypothetical protein